MQLDSHGRYALVRTTSLSAANSTGLGTALNTARFSRFTGLFSIIGSATFVYRMGIATGVYQVTSSMVINSGGSVLDVINYGQFSEMFFSAINSQIASVVVLGEPVR